MSTQGTGSGSAAANAVAGSSNITPAARNASTTTGAVKKLTNPRSREAPKFDSSQPKELLRFFDEMEIMFEEAGMTGHSARKNALGRYTDSVTQQQWEGLPGFETSTWEKFKEQIISNYPEAETLKMGTLRSLEKMCQVHRGIDIDDFPQLVAFRREFVPEAEKLIKNGMAGEREIVSLLRGTLTTEFDQRVFDSMVQTSVHRAALSNTGEAVPGHWTSSHQMHQKGFTLHEWMETAYTLAAARNSGAYANSIRSLPSEDRRARVKSEESSSSSHKPNRVDSISPKIEERLSEFAEKMRSNQDKIKSVENSMVNLHNQTNQKLDELVKQVSVISTNMNTSAQWGYRGPGPMGPPRSSNMTCFFCGGPHMMSACDVKQSYLEKGIIRNTPGGLKLANGQSIPPETAEFKTMKARIDNLANAPKQMFYGDPSTVRGGFYNVSTDDMNGIFENRDWNSVQDNYNNYPAQFYNAPPVYNNMMHGAQQTVQPVYSPHPPAHVYNYMMLGGQPVQQPQQVVQPTYMAAMAANQPPMMQAVQAAEPQKEDSKGLRDEVDSMKQMFRDFAEQFQISTRAKAGKHSQEDFQ